MNTGLRVVLHLLQVVFLAVAALGATWSLVDFYLEVQAPAYDTSVLLGLLVIAVVGVGLSPTLWSTRRHAPPAPPAAEEPAPQQFSAFTPPAQMQQQPQPGASPQQR